MARPAERWVCQACGTSTSKWAGRCEACGGWNTLVEEGAAAPIPGGLKSLKGRKLDLVALDGPIPVAPRFSTGIGELDRVTGGGLVPGSAVLIGGDPGIGKSTLLLQAMALIAKAGHNAAYISGEEAVAQVRLRAQRLGLEQAPLKIASETSLKDILATLDSGPPMAAVVIDSIQTLHTEDLESAPGTVSQVRTVAAELVRLAKRRGTAVLLVGHVTKEGQIAGPRVVEHLVDTVLYFEGERGHSFRILRAVKNRFGATDEIGVFEMRDVGLAEVVNPSALFLSQRDTAVAGAAVFAGVEGTRPLLVEIQALVAPEQPGTPRRAVVGWDSGRLAMTLAVLQTRCGLALSQRDVYLNVAGGLRVAEPAADLAVAAALLSSLADRSVPEHSILFGEIGLTGEIRRVAQAETRLKEAAKLGFRKAFVPAGTAARRIEGMDVVEVARLPELIAHVVGT
ncbi:DNA repair protein RadA [Zavarzinia sp. CC-PAN008]|uniref:DNA repair protein RadA n=1 Tax=Zavarzinia sp. CC-PAN008 TaxID=3243332 RepID=UPI003F7452A2